MGHRFPVIIGLMELDVRNVIWKLRQTDMLGQIILILTGVFGVVVLFKEGLNNDK